MDLAQVGATPKGGVRRLALTEVDRQGRDLFVRWAREAGLAVRWDAVGNIFARREGTEPRLPPVVMGSHLDTQPSGGKFDGAYGVMAGLEVLRTLNERRIATRAPMEVAAWTNEEGSRFPPGMAGSGVFAGAHELSEIWSAKDLDGTTFEQALKAIGYAGSGGPHKVGAYFEAHIEQGPVLEDTRTTIGVVQGALGQRWFDVLVTGMDAHAGPTPMDMRKDALIGASRFVLEVNRIARAYPDYARATVGFMQVKPNSRNVVPGEVRTSVDMRNASDRTLSLMKEDLQKSAKSIEAECRVAIELKEIVHFPPCEFAPALVDSVRRAAKDLGLSHRDIVSGAGHDAVYLARESARPEDLAAGCEVLFRAALEAAGGRP
jgi:N-carbamoyl-L-amino-acid hydrolase